MRLRALAVAGAAAAGIAFAPAGAHAWPGAAPPPRRSGFTIGVGLGPGTYFGVGGLDQFAGVGGTGSFRVGTTAGDNLLWLLEVDGGGYPAQVGTGSNATIVVNQTQLLALAAQIYVRPVLWVKLGAGVATALRKDGSGATQGRATGVGALGALGYDLFRRGNFVVDLELSLSIAAYARTPAGGAGGLSHGGLALAAQWY